MLVQEPKRAFAIDGVAAIEKFDFRLLCQVELRIQPSNFGVLVSHPLISSYVIVICPRSTMNGRGSMR